MDPTKSEKINNPLPATGEDESKPESVKISAPQDLQKKEDKDIAVDKNEEVKAPDSNIDTVPIIPYLESEPRVGEAGRDSKSKVVGVVTDSAEGVVSSSSEPAVVKEAGVRTGDESDVGNVGMDTARAPPQEVAATVVSESEVADGGSGMSLEEGTAAVVSERAEIKDADGGDIIPIEEGMRITTMKSEGGEDIIPLQEGSPRNVVDEEGGVHPGVREGGATSKTGRDLVSPETGEPVGGVPQAGGNETTQSKEEAESTILKRMEATFLSSLETQNQLQQLTQLIGALEKAPRVFPQDAPTVEAVNETQGAAAIPFPVGDTIAHAALIGGMTETGEEVEEAYLEACQPSDSVGGGSAGLVVVAGEIVSTDGSMGLGGDTALPTAPGVKGDDTVIGSQDTESLLTSSPASSDPQASPVLSPSSSTSNPEVKPASCETQKSSASLDSLPPTPGKRSRFHLAATFTK